MTNDRLESRGQGVVEYGIILAGLALITIVALLFFGDPIARVLDLISRLVEGSS